MWLGVVVSLAGNQFYVAVLRLLASVNYWTEPTRFFATPVGMVSSLGPLSVPEPPLPYPVRAHALLVFNIDSEQICRQRRT